MHTNTWYRIVGMVISLMFVGMVAGTAQAWPTAAPQDVGIDPTGLAQAEEFAAANLPDIRSLLVLKDGTLVLEKYYQTGAFDIQQEVYSVTKTIVALLVGIALDQQKLSSLDQTLGELVPDAFTAGTNAELKTLTVRHLLTMSSGLDWKEDYAMPETVASQWMASPDWVTFALSLKQNQTPGGAFEYTSPNAHLLSVVLSHVTGMSTKDFAQQVLFDPLGIAVNTWNTDPQGYNIGSFGLALSPHDLTKLGMLFLQAGQWEGQQIVSQAWLTDATSAKIATGWGLDYGYFWWLKSLNGCTGTLAWGMSGQFIVVIPQQQTVIVTTGKPEYPLTSGAEYVPLFDMLSTATGAVCTQ